MLRGPRSRARLDGGGLALTEGRRCCGLQSVDDVGGKLSVVTVHWLGAAAVLVGASVTEPSDGAAAAGDGGRQVGFPSRHRSSASAHGRLQWAHRKPPLEMEGSLVRWF